MKPVTILISCLLLSFCAAKPINAQVIPGYKGKRLLAEANLLFSPTYNYPTKNGKSLREKDWLAFNKRYQLGLSYVIGRQLALRFNYDRLTTAYKGSLRFNNQFYDYLKEVKASTIGIGVDFSAYWSMAPIGPSYGFSINRGTTKRSFSEFLGSQQEMVKQYEEDRYYVIDFRLIQRQILTGNLYLMYGGSLAYAWGMNDFDGAGTFDRGGYKRRMEMHYLVNMQIGVGYLIL